MPELLFLLIFPPNQTRSVRRGSETSPEIAGALRGEGYNKKNANDYLKLECSRSGIEGAGGAT